MKSTKNLRNQMVTANSNWTHFSHVTSSD